MNARRDRLIIRLPEGVTFSHTLAGPVSRVSAFMIDLCVIGLLTTLEGYATSLVNALNKDLGGALYILCYFLIYVGYGIACEYWWHGQTLGKWLLGLRVVDLSGLELRFSQVALRNLLRPVDMLPFFGLAGGVTIFFNLRNQRLGDIAGGTVVIRSIAHGRTDISALTRGRYNTLRQQTVLCARLRQKVSPELAALATEASFRRNEFDAASRLLLFNELAMHFKALADIPEADIESLSPEQLVRNVVEVLSLRISEQELPPPLRRQGSAPAPL
jgi:uncharacterized RDD family membrane protein YckC